MKRYVRADGWNNDISKVSLEKLNEVLDSADREGKYRPLGYFYAYDPKSNVWVAIDNGDGSAWTEEFPTEKKAISWLNGDFEVGDEDNEDDDIINAATNYGSQPDELTKFADFDKQKYYKMYSNIFRTITDGANADIPNNIKEAFKLAGGRAFYARAESPTYIKFDGMVGSDYTVGGSISMSYLQGDARRLAEDLTMAYFRTTEGTKVPCNTYQFVDWFNS